MKLTTFKPYLPYLVGGVALYLVWVWLKKKGEGAGTSIADALIVLFGLDKTDIRINGNYIFPDNSVLAIDQVAQIASNQYWQNDKYYMVINGVTYQVLSSDSDGNYPLVKV